MAKRNPYPGYCSVCGARMRAYEGVVEAADKPPWYRLLCVEHASAASLAPPKPPEASRLPSIHVDEEPRRR